MTKKNRHIFIIDDDKSIRWVLEKILIKNNFTVSSFEDAESMLNDLDSITPNVIISDIRMPGINGTDMLEQVKREYPKIPIIMMTAFSDLETTVMSLKKGAYEYVTKPFDINEISALVEKACKSSTTNNLGNKTYTSKNISKIIGSSESMQKIYNLIGKIAQTDVDVLILGETGTGKELIAKAIHENSDRKDNPFIAINTGAIPTELLESELFGHEKGSFTGAYNQRIGRFEQASDGTLFLDEIGDMPIDVQTRLLRVVQEGEFFRVGGTKSIKIKTRIITATHKNLNLLVANNLFREDLLHRINAIKIELPSLKNRSSDILELAEHFLEEYSKEYKVMRKILTSDVKKYFLKYEWPGNIRELQNVCKYLSIMSIDQEIITDDLPRDLLDDNSLAKKDKDWGDVLERWILSEFNKNSINISKNIDSIYESVLIKSSLKLSSGNKTEAAKILGWGRNTITNKIKNLE